MKQYKLLLGLSSTTIRLFTLLAVVLLMQAELSAQKTVIAAATDLIIAKKYSEANHYLDSLLKKNTKCVDCLMMKGNVLLNAVMDTVSAMQFISEEDESVFTPSIAEKPKLLPKRTVYEVERYWKKCLEIDSARTDIRKGLCTIYSLGLLKDSLKAELAKLRKSLSNEPEEAFRLSEYARNFKERNRFEDGMEIYQLVANLYPEVAGIRCDMASEYFYAGRLNETLNWLDSCYQFKTVDETSFLNGAFIYSELGYFDNAQSVLNAYSRIYQRRMDEFYYGLYLFSDSNSKCFETLRHFYSEVDTTAYTAEVLLTRILLQAEDSFTISIYSDCVTNPEIPDYYKTLIHARAMKQFVGNCKPFMLFGLYQAQIRNYSAAAQFLEEQGSCEMKAAEKEYRAIVQVYTFYKENLANDFMRAASSLTSSPTSFYRQGANYFMALMFLANEKIQDAKQILEKIVAEKEKTKYGELAVIKLKEIK